MRDPEPSLRPLLVRAAVAGVLFVLASLALIRAVPKVRDPETIRAYVLGVGALAPAAFVLIQIVQVLLAPVPGHAIAVAGGYLFGPWLGTAYSLSGWQNASVAREPRHPATIMPLPRPPSWTSPPGLGAGFLLFFFVLVFDLQHLVVPTIKFITST